MLSNQEESTILNENALNAWLFAKIERGTTTF
jgi:hypothetical protein